VDFCCIFAAVGIKRKNDEKDSKQTYCKALIRAVKPSIQPERYAKFCLHLSEKFKKAIKNIDIR
jgi:hypothetical protein